VPSLAASAAISPAGPKTFVDIGCNKGYTTAKLIGLWAPEVGFRPQALQSKRPEILCGTCKDCEEKVRARELKPGRPIRGLHGGHHCLKGLLRSRQAGAACEGSKRERALWCQGHGLYQRLHAAPSPARQPAAATQPAMSSGRARRRHVSRSVSPPPPGHAWPVQVSPARQQSAGEVQVFCMEPSLHNFANLVLTRDAFFSGAPANVQW
jgi:hypothetical protein